MSVADVSRTVQLASIGKRPGNRVLQVCRNYIYPVSFLFTCLCVLLVGDGAHVSNGGPLS